MVEIHIKYGKSEIPYEIQEKNLWEIVQTKNEPKGCESNTEATKEIKRALANPIGAPRISQVVKAGERVVITQDDI